ncbi:MAG: hypothetical protein ABID38_04020 [Candidatus Diapherotrites archaeon]
MAETLLICGKIVDMVDALQNRIDGKDWKDYSRTSFIYNLASTIHELEEISLNLEFVRNEFQHHAYTNAPEISNHMKEINSLIAFLKRNRKLEEGLIEKAMDRGVDLEELVHAPDLYSSLEQKVLSLLLKTRYLIERLEVFARKNEGKPIEGKANRTLLELIDVKEDELQKVKEKYAELKSKSFWGKLEEGNSSDLENDLSELERKLGSSNSLVEESLRMHKRQAENLTSSREDLEGRVSELEEIVSQYQRKTSELIASLKKERDYAKKIVLETEHETLKLRNTYSKELLNLEQEKISVREQARGELKGKIAAIKKELGEKKDLVERFKKMVDGREKKIGELEGEISKLKRKKAGKK